MISASKSADASVADAVCALIVTYNPSPSLYQNVLAVREQVSSVLLVDNASGAAHQSTLEQVAALPGVEIVRNPRNLGIGAALNAGVRWAIERRFSWVATFDQDSRAQPGFIDEMLRAYGARSDRSSIAMLAPRYVEAGLGLLHDDSRDTSSELILTSMMSGNLVRTEAISRVGFYDEGFFIDYVDHEFCLRLARHGYRVLKCKNSVLQHQLGRMSRSRVAGVMVTTTNHGPLRRYYNARNRILVYRRYWRMAPAWIARDLRSFAVETMKILLVEQDRGAKLANVARGVWRGITGSTNPALQA